MPKLVEASIRLPFGSMVGWKTPRGAVYGVVVGNAGRDLLCLSSYDKTLRKDPGLRFYRDEELSGKLDKVLPTVDMALQRVPATRAFLRGRIQGSALRPFIQAAATLRLEAAGIDEGEWIQTAIKRPGRLRQILGISDDEWEAMSAGEKLRQVNAALKTTSDKSERGALLLGKRFLGGDLKPRRKEEGQESSMRVDEVDITDAEEEVAELLRKSEKARGGGKRKLLMRAAKILRKSGLAKERDWVQQFNMRAHGTGVSLSESLYDVTTRLQALHEMLVSESGAASYSVLKRACGVTSTKSLTPSEIVRQGGGKLGVRGRTEEARETLREATTGGEVVGRVGRYSLVRLAPRRTPRARGVDRDRWEVRYPTRAGTEARIATIVASADGEDYDVQVGTLRPETIPRSFTSVEQAFQAAIRRWGKYHAKG